MSESTAVAQSQAPSLLATMAARFGVEPKKMLATLKATAFKGEVTDEQMMALLIVANQYGLNPWTKEIYAFPDKNNGIVPVMGVDGWTRIMNSNPEFDGIEFSFGEKGEWCECTIYRKDRTRPTKVREYLSECKRNTGPWGSHPQRMLRHKALIQCARVAFSYGGIYDEDEAAQIIERDVTPITGTVSTQGATARLREVATINQEVNDGADGGTQETDSERNGKSKRTDRNSTGNDAIGVDVGDQGVRGESDDRKGESPSHGASTSNAPTPKPSSEIIEKIRSIKTLDALDEYISVFDGGKYSEAERQTIQKAYLNRKELLVEKPAGAGRKGVD